MKVRSSKSLKKGFTLIEMIGVLAVIAILAALLIPKIFEAINNARVNNAAISCQTVKTAIADHYAKYGSLASSNGVVIALGGGFDNVLLGEGFIDKPFATKIGNQTGADTQLVDISAVDGTGAGSTAGTSYDLDGDGAADALGSVLVQCVITGVTANDAWELSKLIDGGQVSTDDGNGNVTTSGLSVGAPGTADALGRVVYAAPANGVTDVYVYLTHR